MNDFIIFLIFVGFLVVAAIILLMRFASVAEAKRRKMLQEKYRDQAIVDRILKKQVWQGQTREQLIDSLGKPAAIEQQVFKSKIKVVYKYGQESAKRFRVRVTMENDTVVGWNAR
jgi:hypothetical protein